MPIYQSEPTGDLWREVLALEPPVGLTADYLTQLQNVIEMARRSVVHLPRRGTRRGRIIKTAHLLNYFGDETCRLVTHAPALCARWMSQGGNRRCLSRAVMLAKVSEQG